MSNRNLPTCGRISHFCAILAVCAIFVNACSTGSDEEEADSLKSTESGASSALRIAQSVESTPAAISGNWQHRSAHLDAQGSPIAITSATGNILNRTRFDAFGVETQLFGMRDQAISYQGYWSDAELQETGNLLSAARIYVPGLGVFGERDPIEGVKNEPITFNPYPISCSNPHAWLDPDGRIGIFFDGTNNNRHNVDSIKDNALTNVSALYELYPEGKGFCHKGVGTGGTVNYAACGFTGCGFNAR